MKNVKIKVLLALMGVACGLGLFIAAATLASRMLGISDLHRLLGFVPRRILLFVGTANLLAFFPIFLSGILALKPRGAVGMSEKLVQGGIYRYLRNPFYAGVSFSMVGLGLLLGASGVFLAGLVWLGICFVQCRREERELAARFGSEYLAYKERTPMFIPRFELMVRDCFRR